MCIIDNALVSINFHCNVYIGNLYTLDTQAIENNIDVRKELLNFHQQYYSANLMTVGIVGKGIL